MKRLKHSTRNNLRTLIGLVAVLSNGVSATFFIYGASMLDIPPMLKIVSFLIADLFVVVALFSAGYTFRLTKQRIYKRKQGWLEDPIPANHGATIFDVAQGIRNENVEYMAYFMPSGEKLFEVTINHPSEVYLTPAQNAFIKAHPGCISIHNHPGGHVSKHNFITAFSENDMFAACSMHESRAIVVSEDICFVMNYPSDIDKAQVDEILDFIDGCPDCYYTFCVKGGTMLYNYVVGGRLDRYSIALCDTIAKRFGLDFKLTTIDDTEAYALLNTVSHDFS